MSGEAAGDELEAGRRVGHYELLARVGSGGMGEVYRARDLRLQREVALKVLPPDVQTDRRRLERFAQEARAAARLSHPNILVVHELAEHDAQVFLVSELLEGETLRQRLARGALPWRKGVDYGSQLCAGLAAAHERGIVHCDLKPENLFITRSDDRLKILDFGLAHLKEESAGSTAAATLSLHSDAGIHGTLGYLAPEQLRREALDPRTDLFAVGAVLYEMLSGRRAFGGDTPAAAAGAILGEDPAPLPHRIPPALARVVERCLEKEPSARFRSAHDLGLALEAGARAGDPRAWRALLDSLGRRGLLHALLTAALLSAAIVLAFRAGARHYVPVALPAPVSFAVQLPSDTGLVEFTAAPLALTPDRRNLILALANTDGSMLWRRPLDADSLSPIAGTEGASSPFLSPDGQWIAFAADGKVKRVGIDGGATQIVADAPQFFGGCWLNDETIVYVPRWSQGLWRVAASGGRPEQLTAPRGGEDGAHLWPTCLPDGKSVLYTGWRGGTDVDDAEIYYLQIDTHREGLLVHGGYFPRYLKANVLLYASLGTLMAAPFDPAALALRGRARALRHELLTNVNSGVAFFESSNSDAVAYVQGAYAQPERRLIWLDRTGSETRASAVARPYSSPRIAPDGRRVAIWLQDAAVGVWLLDPALDQLSRLSRGIDDHNPAWSPDGRRVAFDSTRAGHHRLYVVDVDHPGTETQLTTPPKDYFVNQWLPDGKLLCTDYTVDKGSGLWLVDSRDGAAEALMPSPFALSEPAVSADGRLIAYVSEESGARNVYVQRFPGNGERALVSRNGGQEPVWSRAGTELYYRHGHELFAAQVHADTRLEVASPQRLFSGSFHTSLYPTATYDVGPDGRFLMVEEEPPQPRTIHVTLYFGQALQDEESTPKR